MKILTSERIELFKKSNKNLMVSASLVLLSAYILVNEPSEEVKNLDAEEFAGTWAFIKDKLSKDLVEKLINAQPSEGAKTYVQDLLNRPVLKGFKASDLVEHVFEVVKAQVAK